MLGIPFNLDQYLASEAIERAGAGLTVRAGLADARTVAVALGRLLAERAFTTQATRVAADLGRSNASAAFAALVDRATA